MLLKLVTYVSLLVLVGSIYGDACAPITCRTGCKNVTDPGTGCPVCSCTTSNDCRKIDCPSGQFCFRVGTGWKCISHIARKKRLAVCAPIQCRKECKLLALPGIECPVCVCSRSRDCRTFGCPSGQYCEGSQTGWLCVPDVGRKKRLAVPVCPSVTCKFGCRKVVNPLTKCPVCICAPMRDCRTDGCPMDQTCQQVSNVWQCVRNLVRKKRLAARVICPMVMCKIGCEQVPDPSGGCPKCVCPVVDPIPVRDCRTDGCPEGQTCKEVASGCENTLLKPLCKPLSVWKCVPVRVICPMVMCKIGCERVPGPSGGCPKCVCPAVEPILVRDCKTDGCPMGQACKEVASGCENPPPGQPCDPILEWKCVPDVVCPMVMCMKNCRSVPDPNGGCPTCICPEPIPTGNCRTDGCPVGEECQLKVWGCENPPPNQPCDPIAEWTCVPTKIEPCPVIPCPIRCRFGLKHDENGCQLCECLPNPCDMIECAPGYTCEVVPSDNCQLPNCLPFVAKCRYECPMLKCKTCEGGNVVDDHGCMTCQCLNPCEGVTCEDGLVCQAAPRGLEPRYECVKPKPLCCPKPRPPRNCALIPQNICQYCSKDCTTIKCGRDTMCCPDWYGCHGCVKAVPC